MSAPDPIVQVYLKETREMFRDRRVRFAAFVMPFVIMTLLLSMFGAIMANVGKNAKKKIYVVASTPGVLIEQLKQSKDLETQVLPDEATGIDMIKKGKATLVVESSSPDAQGVTPVKLLYDPKEETAEVVKASVQSAFQKYQDNFETQALTSHGMTEAQVKPLKFVDDLIKVGEGQGAGAFVVSLLPYLLMLFTFTGGMNMAGDMVAGEKEKMTLETLLITPVPRIRIVLGKFLALGTICLCSSLTSIVALGVASQIKTAGAEAMFANGLGITPKMLGILFILLLPLVGFFAGALVAVSSYAKNSREAQTYLTVLMLFVIIPAAFSQVIGLTGYDKSDWINFVPVLNTAVNIRNDLLGKTSWAGVGITVIEGLILAALALRLAVYLFNREQVLERT